MIRRSADRVSMGVEALRRLTNDDGPAASITRARLLERVHRAGRRRLAVIASGLAATAIVSGALAATIFGAGTQPPAPASRPAVTRAIAERTPPGPSFAPPPGGVVPPAAADDGDTELASYGRAHTAHFVRRRFSEALQLWTTYLRGYPKGRFVPEATYNRALAFVHLGRSREAIAALKPIAAGQFGDYRRQEAEALLGALTAARDSKR